MESRRQFLKGAGALSLWSATSAASTLVSFAARAADSSGYKALVCVFLDGGMDNYDTILPYDQASYDRYANIRQPLINAYDDNRARSNLLPLRPANAAQFGSREFALPSELEPLHALFDAGVAAVVGNVGPLTRPITKADFEMDKGSVPLRLFSHNDQRSTWLSLSPEGALSGWGGRFADAHVESKASEHSAFSAVSLFGDSVFLSGNVVRCYQLEPTGPLSLYALTMPSLNFANHLSDSVYAKLRAHFAAENVGGTNLLTHDIAAEHNRAFEKNELFRSAEADAPALQTVFPNTRLGQQLSGVARTIALRDKLRVTRQVFFASLPGFDTHSDQASDLPVLHHEFAQAVKVFYAAMQELGAALDVTLFTASDFGRTLAVNGDGTDHGWGNHHFVIGGSVLGGRIYGDLPPIDFGHQQDAGGGRLIPQVSIHQYAATLGAWFGLMPDELQAALPGLKNFPQRPMFV